MEIRKLKPTSPGQRHKIVIAKNILSKNNYLLKFLVNGFIRKKGRSGKITVRHKGSGCKKLYRLVNLGNFKSKFIVLSNIYDPYRSSFVSLVFDLCKNYFEFISMTEFIYPGVLLVFDFEDGILDLKLGYRTWLKNIPMGSFIHNLSIKPESKAKFARSAGTKAQLIQKSLSNFKVRLPSGKILTTKHFAVANIGISSNLQNKLIVLGKAGASCLRGKRPAVRGIVMNPIDHPHGGKSNGGRALTPWSKSTRGVKTKKKTKYYDL